MMNAMHDKKLKLLKRNIFHQHKKQPHLPLLTTKYGKPNTNMRGKKNEMKHPSTKKLVRSKKSYNNEFPVPFSER